MEPLFTNTCTYDQKNQLQMSGRASFRRWLLLVYAVIALALIPLGIVFEDSYTCLLGILFVVLDIFLLFKSRLIIRGRIRQLEQLYSRAPEMYIEFFDDHMASRNQQDGGTVTTAYTQLKKVLQTKDLYILMLPRRLCFLVDKHRFSGTTEEEFVKFICARACNAKIDRKIAWARDKRTVGARLWRVETAAGTHFVEYRPKRGYQKVRLFLNGNEVALPSGLQASLVGVDIPLLLGDKECRFLLKTGLLSRPTADLAVDGVFLDSKKAYEPLRKIPWWGWIFVALSLAAAVLGGAIPIMVGLIGAGLCVTVITSGRLKTLWKVLLSLLLTVAVWGIVLGVSLGLFTIMDMSRKNIDQTFTEENYSIVLTEAFEAENDSVDYYWEAYSSDVGVYVLRDSEVELAGYGYRNITPGEYIQVLNESADIYADVGSLPNGYAVSSYTMTYEDGDWFYYDVAVKAEGYYWFTEFYCQAEDADEYTPLFEQWAQTIQIG